jgi:hypothetical protein
MHEGWQAKLRMGFQMMTRHCRQLEAEKVGVEVIS